MTAEGCMIAFVEELNYWEIEERVLEECCHQKYLMARYSLQCIVHISSAAIISTHCTVLSTQCTINSEQHTVYNRH